MPLKTTSPARVPGGADGEDEGGVEWYNDPRPDAAWESALTRTTHRGLVDSGYDSHAYSNSGAVLQASPRPPPPNASPKHQTREAGSAPRGYSVVVPPPPRRRGRASAVPGTRRVHLVHDPSEADRDITIRLKMDIEEDFGGDLEEFCRLRRLGRFKDARVHWFGSTLKQRSADPYVQVQYAEMLLASGDYRSLRDLPPLSRRHPNHGTRPRGDGPSKMDDNYVLLHLLSHGTDAPDTDLVHRSVAAVKKALDVHPGSPEFGSTEIQLIALSFRAVDHADAWAPRRHIATLRRMVGDPRLNFHHLYSVLVGEGRVWDFRDLLLAVSSSLGWEAASQRFFGPVSDAGVIDAILEDWERPGFDEGSTLGLLDLFTSLILQDPREYLKKRNALLLRECQALVASIGSSEHHQDLMRSRPFVQFLLARAVLELNPAPPASWRHGASRGMFLYQGPGIQLPLYVPARDGKKPAWETLFSRSTPEQRRAVEVAAGMAHHLADYWLHAQALKLLILQSEKPQAGIGALADLQSKTQGDRQGYFSTNLSGYLVATTKDEQRDLLRILELPEGISHSLYFENLNSKPLKWAWAVIRVFLVASTADGVPSGSLPTIAASYFEDEFTSINLSDLHPRIREFSHGELGIPERWSRGASRDRSPTPERRRSRSRHHATDEDEDEDEDEAHDDDDDDDDDDNDDDDSFQSSVPSSDLSDSNGSTTLHVQGVKNKNPEPFITITRANHSVKFERAERDRRAMPPPPRRTVPPPPRPAMPPPPHRAMQQAPSPWAMPPPPRRPRLSQDRLARLLADDDETRRLAKRVIDEIEHKKHAARDFSPPGSVAGGFARTVVSDGEEDSPLTEEIRITHRAGRSGGKEPEKAGAAVVVAESPLAKNHAALAVEDGTEVVARNRGGNDTAQGQAPGPAGDDGGVVVEEVVEPVDEELGLASVDVRKPATPRINIFSNYE